MPKPKGSKKTGGRKKGTPNMRTRNLYEVLDSIDFNIPAQILALLPELKPDKRADVLLKMLEYIYPKRKAIDIQTWEEKQHAQVVISIPSNGREVQISN